jgi:exopolysaccharide biosynthesis polyprenyl glycosylphosphotransferase
MIDNLLRHNIQSLSERKSLSDNMFRDSQIGLSPEEAKSNSKEIGRDDENILRGRLKRGAQNQMHTFTKTPNPRVSDSREAPMDNVSNDTPKGSVDKYRLERVIYCLMTSTLLAVGIVSFNFKLGFFANSISLYALILLMVSVKMLAYFKLPPIDLIPVRKKRREIKDFLKHELKFGFILVAAIFFLSLVINPGHLVIFLITNFGLQSIIYIMWRNYNRIALRACARNVSAPYLKNAIIVGASKRGQKAADLILKHPDLNLHILGFVDYHKKNLWRYRDVPMIGHPDDMDSIVVRNQVDYVIMAVEAHDFKDSQQVFSMVEKMGISICVLPDIYERKMSKCRASSMNGQPILLYHSCPENCRVGMFLKLMVDKIGALIGLAASFPILLFSAIAIKLESKGPIFFKQTRSGKNGKEFKMLKLRTMQHNADRVKDKLKHLNEMTGPVFKIKNDPRVTRVGRLLRKFSIDEFPQFFNILVGDMSLVGPRPPLPNEVAEYDPWQRRKLSVKPGATCLWQINGRNAVDFDKWMRLDLEYIDNWSLKEDARIIIKTVPAVLKGKGAS